MRTPETRAQPIPLVYHFTGAEIPGWALVTLGHSGKNWPGPVYFLHDRKAFVPPRGVISVQLDGWYDPKPFQSFAEKFARPRDFRDGFWFHAIERFFVLSQWAKFAEQSRFLHTELDVVLMGHNTLIGVLPRSPQGVMYPRASDENAGANVLYVNGEDSLLPLVDYFLSRSGDEFEMRLLAKFLDEHPEQGIALPSHVNLGRNAYRSSSLNHMQPGSLGGVVDVHPLGTWMFGQDPRNEKYGSVFNHYYYPLIGSEDLREMKFRFHWSSKQLFVTGLDKTEWPVFALHIHSKVMRRAHSRIGMWAYSLLANRERRTLVILQNVHRRPLAGLQLLIDRFYRGIVRPLRGSRRHDRR